MDSGEKTQNPEPETAGKQLDDERDEAESGLPLIPRAAAPSFSSLFSQEEEILILEEYNIFVERNGHNMKNKWVEFRKISKLRDEYNPRQIAKKIGGLQKKFEKKKIDASPPRDPHQSRLFQLSKSLWGNHDHQKSAAGRKRVLAHDDHDNSLLSPLKKKKKKSESESEDKRLEKEWADLRVKELDLFYQKLLLEQKECEIILEKLKLHQFTTLQSSSSSKKKHSEEKGTCQVTYPNNDAELFNDDSEDVVAEGFELKEKDCEHERLISLDGGISSKEDIVPGCEIVEDDEGSEREVMEDLSIDCAEDKIENQPSGNHLPSFDGVENDDLPVTHERGVVDGDSGSKKRRKEKKSSRKKKEVKTTLPSGVVIEELAKGDPNGKLASPGMKVKVHFTAKLKDSEYVFESTIDKAPRIICLGDEAMIDGFCIGVDGMRVGGKRRFIIPPFLGFGEEGYGDLIPPNSWLEYEVELVGVRTP